MHEVTHQDEDSEKITHAWKLIQLVSRTDSQSQSENNGPLGHGYDNAGFNIVKKSHNNGGKITTSMKTGYETDVDNALMSDSASEIMRKASQEAFTQQEENLENVLKIANDISPGIPDDVPICEPHLFESGTDSSALSADLEPQVRLPSKDCYHMVPMSHLICP